MKDRLIFIAAALESIELIQSYTEGYDLPGFFQRIEKLRMPLSEILKSSAKHLNFGIEALLTIRPDMPWREIAGMRNVLAHEYLGEDTVMVWDTLKTHLFDLQQVLEEIMRVTKDAG